MTYKEVIDRGFKRKEGDDEVFINEKGYDWFWAEKTMLKTRKIGIYLYWDCDTHEVHQIRMNWADGKILGRLKVRDVESLDKVLAFWGKQTDINQQKH